MRNLFVGLGLLGLVGCGSSKHYIISCGNIPAEVTNVQHSSTLTWELDEVTTGLHYIISGVPCMFVEIKK